MKTRWVTTRPISPLSSADNHRQALPLLKAAYDRGLNTWDTADIYSNGHSEEVIAKAIKTYHIPRDKVVLMTKCFAYIGEEHVRPMNSPVLE